MPLGMKRELRASQCENVNKRANQKRKYARVNHVFLGWKN